MTTSSFIPRATFPGLRTLTVPHTYYLGHHAQGLRRMKQMLESIHLVIECRDYRIPISSRNPQLAHALAGRPRMIVYTKSDLGWELPSDSPNDPLYAARKLHDSHLRDSRPLTDPDHIDVRFTTVSPTSSSSPSIASLLARITRTLGASPNQPLTGHRVLVAGMPNNGKSTLINALRYAATGKGKAARTGAQPGITRSVGTPIKIVDAADRVDVRDVYLLDTPGVFMPYVEEPRAMLHLALCGCVKRSLFHPQTLADYLLFRVNLEDPAAYAEYAAPTNDVETLLEGIARTTGKLLKGGVPDLDAAAEWWVARWEAGRVRKFVLEGVDEGEPKEPEISFRHAQKVDKQYVADRKAIVREQKAREKRRKIR